jgi:hypothetical protein
MIHDPSMISSQNNSITTVGCLILYSLAHSTNLILESIQLKFSIMADEETPAAAETEVAEMSVLDALKEVSFCLRSIP